MLFARLRCEIIARIESLDSYYFGLVAIGPGIEADRAPRLTNYRESSRFDSASRR